MQYSCRGSESRFRAAMSLIEKISPNPPRRPPASVRTAAAVLTHRQTRQTHRRNALQRLTFIFQSSNVTDRKKIPEAPTTTPGPMSPLLQLSQHTGPIRALPGSAFHPNRCPTRLPRLSVPKKKKKRATADTDVSGRAVQVSEHTPANVTRLSQRGQGADSHPSHCVCFREAM